MRFWIQCRSDRPRMRFWIHCGTSRAKCFSTGVLRRIDLNRSASLDPHLTHSIGCLLVPNTNVPSGWSDVTVSVKPPQYRVEDMRLIAVSYTHLRAHETDS